MPRIVKVASAVVQANFHSGSPGMFVPSRSRREVSPRV
jgi:hypothetical protein